MSAESNLELAAYFARRATKARRDDRRERFLAIAKTYREMANADRERETDQDFSARPQQ